MWTPNSHYRRMSTTGSIVAWAFFWWLLIPVYVLYGVGWLTAVIVVNTLIVAWRIVRWVTAQLWRLAAAATHRTRAAA